VDLRAMVAMIFLVGSSIWRRMVVVETESISGSTDPSRRRLAAQWSSWTLMSPESPYFGLAAGGAKVEKETNTFPQDHQRWLD
jgi:hypothetical protein